MSNTRRTLHENIELDYSSNKLFFEENKLLRGNLRANSTRLEGYWQIGPSNKDNKVYHCNGVNPCSI